MQARKALEEAASRRQAMPLCTLPSDAITETWRARGPELLRATAAARASVTELLFRGCPAMFPTRMWGLGRAAGDATLSRVGAISAWGKNG
jgi:hypothetical protein